MENVSVNRARALLHGGIAASRLDGVRLLEHEYHQYWWPLPPSLSVGVRLAEFQARRKFTV